MTETERTALIDVIASAIRGASTYGGYAKDAAVAALAAIRAAGHVVTKSKG